MSEIILTSRKTQLKNHTQNKLTSSVDKHAGRQTEKQVLDRVD